MTTLLEQEMIQQATVLAERAAPAMPEAAEAARLLAGTDVRHLVIAARGSSDNAARFAQYLFGSEIRMQVGLAAPWLFRDPEGAPRLDGAAVLGISQSGRSPDIVNVLTSARSQRRPTIAITEHPDSPLAAQADVVIPLLAGEERSVAATKTYLASLHAIVQIIEALAPSPARRRWLSQLAGLVDSLTMRVLAERTSFDPLLQAPLVTATGRGLLFSAACESALKIRELSGIPAEAFSPPDLMHGPIAAVKTPAAIWLIEPDDDLYRNLPREMTTVVISTDQRIRAGDPIAIRLPVGIPSWVTAILAVIPAQSAALRLAELGGDDVDNPHGLNKVTLTE
jgi:glucosamine--fructose-6-phosphate aminotransferase (isomerizing)